MYNLLTGILQNSTFWIIIWLFVFVFALGVEFGTEQLVSVWFCGGAIVAGILAACKVHYVIQISVFVGLSAILLIIAKTTFAKNFKGRGQSTNYDSMLGDEIMITEKVTPDKNGAGKYRDVVWTVVCDKEIEEGEFAIVKEIRGNKLVVEKKGN